MLLAPPRELLTAEARIAANWSYCDTLNSFSAGLVGVAVSLHATTKADLATYLRRRSSRPYLFAGVIPI